MIDFILELAKGLFGFLTNVLPDSPVQSLIEGASMLQDAIGWINWVFPVTGALGLVAAWLAACVVIVGARTAVRFFGKGTAILGKG